jgi:hypothetical protein
MPLVSNLDLIQGTGEATFTRTTQATLVNKESGLVELAPHNLLLRSEEFDNASWFKTESVIVSDDRIAPDGTVSADKLTSDGTGTKLPAISQTVTVTSGALHTLSFFAKSDESRFLQLTFSGGQVLNTPRANFDLQLGVLGTVDADMTATITAESGYFKISVTVVALTTTLTINAQLVGSAEAARSTSSLFTIGDGIHIWGAQIEERSSVGTYVSTEASVAYGPRFEKGGVLLEGASTNLFLRSEEFDNASWSKSFTGAGSIPIVTANAGVAPDGTMTAERVQFAIGTDIVGDRSFMRQAITTAGDYTISMYVKSNTGVAQEIGIHREGSSLLSVIVPNEWTRITLSDNFTGSNFAGLELRGTLGTGDLTSDILVWGAQLEELPFASSYIKTTTTAVTRAADNLSVPSAGNFNEVEGSISVIAKLIGDVGTDQNILQIDNSRHALIISSDKLRTFVSTTGGTQVDYSDAETFTVGQQVDITYNYKTNNFETFKDRISIGTDTSGLVPTSLVTITLGKGPVSGTELFGHLKDLRIYKNLLTNPQVKSL